MKKIIAATLSAILAFGFNMSTAEVFAQSKELTGEITVSCFDPMTYKSFLDSAAQAFEKKYPGTKVNVEAFSAMPEIRTVSSETEDGGMVMMSIVEVTDDPQSRSDYVTRANTEMISGGGADIYAIDVLPYYKYADNGQLEDLRKYMEDDPEFNMNDYYSNIFDAAMYNGGQYILPLDYGFEILSYDTTLMNPEAAEELTFGKYTYEELVELGFDSFISRHDPDAENPIKLFNLLAGGGNYGSLFGKLLEANYRSFVDIENKKANFKDGRFVNMLETAKEYQEMGYLDVPIDFEAMMQSGSFSDFGSNRMLIWQEYLYKSTNQLMLLQSLIPQSMTGSTDGMLTVSIGRDDITDDDELIGLLANDEGESMFTASQSYGMNANSKNKELAWEFIKFLLSDEMQGSRGLAFNPISKNAAVQKAKYNLSGRLLEPMAVEMEVSKPEAEIDGKDIMTMQGEEPEDSGAVINPQTNGSGNKPSEESEDFSLDFSFGRMAKTSYFGTADIELNDEQQEILDTYMDYLNRYTEMLNSLLIRDNIVDEMIVTETTNFFNGTRTAEEVSNSIQNKVDMYLQE